MSNNVSIINVELIAKLNEATDYFLEHNKNDVIISFCDRKNISLYRPEQLQRRILIPESFNSFELYTYEVDETTQKIIVVSTLERVEVEGYTVRNNYIKANIIDLSNINLSDLSEAEIKKLFKMIESSSNRKSKLIIKNNAIRLTDIPIYFNEVDFEGTVIFTDIIECWFRYSSRIERANLKNVKILGFYQHNIQLFNNCYNLKYVNIENLQLLDENSKKKDIWLSTTFDNCESLETIEGLPSFLKVNNVTEMYATFFKCKSLKKIDLGDDMTYENISTINRICEGCISLSYLNLGDISTATNTYAGSLFGLAENGYPNISSLTIKHKGKFPIDENVNPNFRSYIDEQVVVLEHNNYSQIQKLYTHRCIITNTLIEMVYLTLKHYLHIEKGQARDCNINTLELSSEELEKLLIKQQMLQSNFTIFRGLVAIYDDTLKNLTLVIEKLV